MSAQADDWLSMNGRERKAFTLRLIQLYGAVCCICGLPIKPGEESTQHIPPRSKGGAGQPGTSVAAPADGYGGLTGWIVSGMWRQSGRIGAGVALVPQNRAAARLRTKL